MIAWTVDARPIVELGRLFPRGLTRTVRNSFRGSFKEFRRVFRQDRLRGAPGIKAAPNTVKAFRVYAKGSHLAAVRGGIFTHWKAAATLERGGTIQAKSGGALAIPIGKAVTRGGRVRRVGRRRIQPKDVPDLVQITTKRGNRLLAQVTGKHVRRIQPYFALKRRVRLTPRLGFYVAFRRYQGRLAGRLVKDVHRFIRGRLWRRHGET